MVVKSVDVLSVAKMLAAIQACLGLLIGAIVTLVALAGLGADRDGALPGLLFGVAAVVVLPIFYGVMGAVVGALSALLYNLFAGMVGGVRLDVEQDADLR